MIISNHSLYMKFSIDSNLTKSQNLKAPSSPSWPDDEDKRTL